MLGVILSALWILAVHYNFGMNRNHYWNDRSVVKLSNCRVSSHNFIDPRSRL